MAACRLRPAFGVLLGLGLVVGCANPDVVTVVAPTHVAATPGTLQIDPGLGDQIVVLTTQLHSELLAVEQLTPAPGAEHAQEARFIASTIVPLERSTEFLIGQFNRLQANDQHADIALLRGFLGQLKEFQDKLQKELLDDELPDGLKDASRVPLGTVQSLEGLIVTALGCREFPC